MSSKESKKSKRRGEAMPGEQGPRTQVDATKRPVTEMAEVHAAELEELRRLREDYHQLMDRLKRVSADFDNYRKRIEKQREAWSHDAIEAFVLDLLTVFDDLDRAVEAVKTATSPEDIVSGIKIIESHLTKVLENHGVERIHCLREPFDPSCHEAVEVDESEKHPDPLVLKEYQRGYRFGGKVVKPAAVRVSGKASPESRRDGPEEEAAGEDSSGEGKENENADV